MSPRDLESDFLAAASEVFGVPGDSIGLHTKRGDLAAWDSFAQVMLFLAIEDRFPVKFTTDQIQQLDSLDSIFLEVKGQEAR